MFCPNCKRYAGKGHDFCKKCGAFVPAEDSDSFRYAAFDISGGSRQRGAVRMLNKGLRDTASQGGDAPLRTGQYTQNREPVKRQGQVTVHTVHTPPAIGVPGVPASRPVSAQQAKKAAGCVPAVVFIVLIAVVATIVPLIMTNVDTSDSYADQAVSVSVYEDFLPDEAENCCSVDNLDFFNMTYEANGTVSYFALTPEGVTPLDGDDFPEDFSGNGTMVFDGGPTLDIRYKDGNIYADDSVLEKNVLYKFQYILLESGDGVKYYLVFPDGEQGMVFTDDGVSFSE